ncbi:glycine--tRNA ligase subunit beta [Latilactobacillus sakei]|uniref:Glycine--tRNA ligase beta subunit n=1 Tax=Latilactobacillus sakei TaxID=1599 RepID=A0AAE8J5H9_LATSK|nr:glycine--tRNA ligase subunit beta [Latilactobacillus sakei]AWZ43222.1 glycine--tRNA ligase subunit beta [Latilactobacillus sakei]EOR85022.1 glycyl-tRNA synthetase beta chain [Latilactobacillus sakei subsp. sakei LS25]MDM5044314.1 glycine--tRNA ligase subunit beta [Latilactobacillus sakei]PKX63333.1 glycine--tRNA ligase subunit beta [Latilactobacillus sakei]PKX68331.1 glycine--tRNA ligase subunit beta [Latilactobacillus sakei]
MTKPFLLEIGLEEMPAHVVMPSIQQLEKRVRDFLEEQHLEFGQLKTYATPRRLAILIEDLADKQADIHEEAKGPAKKIALDAEGNWSKAAQGFVRGQGLTTDDITFKELKGVEYVYVEKSIIGKPVEAILPELKAVIMAMTFPTRMHWADYDFEYIRPIHWIIALLDDEVIDFSILNVTTGRTTQGHRFLGQEVTLAKATDYEAALEAQFVIADEAKRQNLIQTQIEKMAQENDWQVDLDANLLEEVTNLVEWPTAFYGQFDAKYLEIPEEVLITSMKDNQRYFYARSQAGDLLPVFIGVRNGNDAFMENVIAGNEKVLTARLEDADFFYHEDQKVTIAENVAKLQNVSFHDKIGSLAEKMTRVGLIAQFLGQKFGLSEAELVDLQRASDIYKFDLVTGMVGEFSELQGVMGEKYALLQGETPAVATAVREHYMPISAEGALPATKVGAVLAIADKFDSMADFFAVGMIPSGSNDPYALRRQAYGIVRILENQDWHFPMADFQAAMSDIVKQQADFDLDWSANAAAISDFLTDRVRQRFNGMRPKVRRDIVDAVLKNQAQDPVVMFEAAKVLSAHQDDADFKATIEAITRVLRLAEKVDFETTDLTVDPALFENDAEKALYTAVEDLRGATATNTLAENYAALQTLRPLIEAYFDATMVMAEDEAVRRNRLTQLMIIAQIALSLGDLNELIVK